MSGLLDGGIAALFGSVFGGLYLDGTLTAVTYADDGTGSLTPSTGTPAAVKVQIDACTWRQKQEEGYTAKDVRLLILQAGAGATPVRGNRVTVGGVTYVINPTIAVDPAASYWECRASPVH